MQTDCCGRGLPHFGYFGGRVNYLSSNCNLPFYTLLMKPPLLFLFLLCFLFGMPGVYASKDTATVNSLLERSKVLQRTNQKESLRLATKAMGIAQEIDYQYGIAGANIRIGSILYTMGKLDSARIVIHESYIIYSTLNSPKGAAAASLLLSYIYLNQGLKDSAFSHIYHALRWNEIQKDSLSLAQIYVHLGNLHLDNGDQENAFKSYRLSANISERNGYDDDAISAWDGLGRYYLKTGEYKHALRYFLKIDSVSSKNGDMYTLAQNYTNIAICHESLREYGPAKTYHQWALKEYTRLNMTADMALGHYNLGSIFLELGQSDSAIHHLNQALVLARQSDDLMRAAKSYQVLSRAYARKGLFDKAYEYQQHYSALSDSLLNSEKVTRIAEMQTKYETEKKEQHITLLDLQNKTRSAQRNVLFVAAALLLLLVITVLLSLLRTRKQKKISEELLRNILPAEVADELKRTGVAEARHFDEVTVLFTDFKHFTQIAEKLSPTELVDLLHSCFKAFDEIITRYHIEKIKTIGDSYMCVGGLPVANKSHATDVVRAGIEIQAWMEQLRVRHLNEGKEPIEMRMGIHSGPVVAGIVGVKKFAYDIWGETVNTASRMEQSGEPGQVNISETTYSKVKDQFICTPRGKIQIKHDRLMDMYFVNEMLPSE